MNIYELLNVEFNWPKDKKLYVFESFAGVGAQVKALERLKINFESIGISEIDKYAIVSYSAIHKNLNKEIKTFEFPSKEEMVKILQDKDVGYDFKLNKHTITTRTNINKVKKYYLADKLSKNYGNISKIKAEILPYIDLFTYSFPCQDLSRAGKMKGMDKGSNTRSGLLWEIERILLESEKCNKLPKILLMENVIEVIGTRNYNNFKSWFNRLESLGYQSFFKILDSAKYGIPQHRERCFMVSIKGNYYYQFPTTKKLEIRVKDILEKNVDLKYYLSYNTVKVFMDERNHNGFIRKNMFTPYNPNERLLAKTITTRSGYRVNDNFIYDNIVCVNRKNKDGSKIRQSCRIMDSNGLASTLTCGYTGFYIMPEKVNNGTDDLIGKFIIQGKELGVINNRLVRRLTPLEAFRLMGFCDIDVHKMIEAGVSEQQLIKQAGNSIVVNVLEAIFINLFKKGG